jgi:myo-inositol-hexaphosphate 3-phosphohydrolase
MVAVAGVMFGLVLIARTTGDLQATDKSLVAAEASGVAGYVTTLVGSESQGTELSWADFQPGGDGLSTSSVALASATTSKTYYVDSAVGSDSNQGTTANGAWRTLEKASRATLSAGDRVLLRRGQTFVGSLQVSESGLPTAQIFVGAFGTGARPVVTGGSSCVRITGAYVTVHGIETRGCSWAGVDFGEGARFSSVAASVMTDSIVGVHLSSGAVNNRVLGNRIYDNRRMSRVTPEPNDDNGAFGVLVNGDLNEVAYNTISGHDAFSYDYGRDGAAVEIYGGQSNHIHHNLGVDNDTFTELGDPRSSGNVFGYNVVRSSLASSTFLVTRGAADGYGPIIGTKLYNNTVFMTGSQSEGFICHAGCNAQILHLRNNIIGAGLKAGYADGPIDENYNLYFRGQTQFTLGPNSIVGDPGFISGTNGVLDLKQGSRAIDSGWVSPYNRDFDGTVVPQDGNGDLRVTADIGAYEFSPPGGATPVPTSTPAATPIRTATPTPRPSATPHATPSPIPTPASPTPGGTPTGGQVVATAETASVPNSGDAADDVAIWVNKANPAHSAVIGTDKLGGLAVYDLSGRQLYYYGGIRPNNVDVRYGVSLGGAVVDVITASETDSDTILIYKINPVTRALVNIRAQARATGFGVSGLCMYNSPVSGKLYVFVTDSSGTLKQFELVITGTLIDYTLVRTLSFSSVTEGCVADDHHRTLYVSQERVALWRLSAEPSGGSVKTQVAPVNGSVLTADLEGLAIYDKKNGTGYLIASSQGSDEFVLFDRISGAQRGRFRIASGAVDGVTHTDGIDVTSDFLGSTYPTGMFVAQDDRNDTGNQNFKLVPWTVISNALRL